MFRFTWRQYFAWISSIKKQVREIMQRMKYCCTYGTKTTAEEISSKPSSHIVKHNNTDWTKPRWLRVTMKKIMKQAVCFELNCLMLNINRVETMWICVWQKPHGYIMDNSPNNPYTTAMYTSMQPIYNHNRNMYSYFTTAYIIIIQPTKTTICSAKTTQ